MTREQRLALAVKVQENLDKLNENEKPINGNHEKAMQVEWNDGHERKIVFIPAEDFSGISIFVYGDGLNTARIGLSTKAAVLLSDGIMRMLNKNKEFIEKLK